MSVSQLEFFTAQQMSVVIPEDYKTEKGFLSTAQYPRGFEPEEDEFGMIVKDGKIEQRLFCICKSWPW